jgi:hypothetical protein
VTSSSSQKQQQQPLTMHRRNQRPLLAHSQQRPRPRHLAPRCWQQVGVLSAWILAGLAVVELTELLAECRLCLSPAAHTLSRPGAKRVPELPPLSLLLPPPLPPPPQASALQARRQPPLPPLTRSWASLWPL